MTPEQRTYAWEWFKFHADQRLRAFNFFLLVAGALTAGALQAVSNRSRLTCLAIGAVGVFISICFYALELRNNQLVSVARSQLRQDPAFSALIVDSPRMLKHKVWLRSFIAVTGMLSLALAAWAGLGLPNA